ncbi:MAG: ABC transporter permease subunit [Gemmatimonadaceae bacterium]|nr:ABC transporter permease subunit [Gemmatimonadaceae bacterium]
MARLYWFVAFSAIWFGLAETGFVSSLLLPHPLDVLRAVGNIGWKLVLHIVATTVRASVGFVVGFAAGVAIGFAIQYSLRVQRVFGPMIDAMRPVPALATLPLFILLFGFSELGRVCLIASGTAVFMATSTVEAVAKVPEQWTRFARVSGLDRRRVFRDVLAQGVVPLLVGPTRLAVALAFTLAIASEFMGAQSGLGYLINTARVNLAMPTIWLAVILLGLVSQAIDLLVTRFYGRSTGWYRGTEQLEA